jgi:hypothetical protein
MNSYAGESKQEDIYHYRFQPIDRYLNNIDVASFGQATRSLEDIVINQPMINPFFWRAIMPILQQCSTASFTHGSNATLLTRTPLSASV